GRVRAVAAGQNVAPLRPVEGMRTRGQRPVVLLDPDADVVAAHRDGLAVDDVGRRGLGGELQATDDATLLMAERQRPREVRIGARVQALRAAAVECGALLASVNG